MTLRSPRSIPYLSLVLKPENRRQLPRLFPKDFASLREQGADAREYICPRGDPSAEPGRAVKVPKRVHREDEFDFEDT